MRFEPSPGPLGDFNYYYAENTALDLCLTWTPTSTPRTPAERLAAQARVRAVVKQPT